MKRIEKMSLANIQGKLSRSEMKKIMAGSIKQCDTCAGYMPLCCYAHTSCCYDSNGACCRP